MSHFTLHVPVAGRDGIKRFPRVGAMFEDRNRETGEVFYTLKLDFPVGATELLAFAPRPRAPVAQKEDDVGSVAPAIELSETGAPAIAAQRTG